MSAPRIGADGDGDRGPAAFGELVARYRRTAGLSQQDLASRSGLTARAIGDLERGLVTRPRWHSVHALATAFGLTGEEHSRFVAAARPHRLVAPAARPAPAPAASGDLIGRSTDTRLVAELVVAGRHRLITLVGPSGVGKSRLAADVAARLPNRAGLDVRTLDLSAVTDATVVAELIAEALGVGGTSRLGPVERIAVQLRDARVVLILDRFERLLPAAPVVRELVGRCVGLTVLSTSQVCLGVDAERIVRLRPLSVPRPGADRDETAASDAVALLVRRAAHERHGFEVTDDNYAAVAEICRKVDGLPLALELAAARLRVLSPAELADRLDHQLALLVGGPRGLPERHRSLRAAIESGLAVAPPEAIDLFAWLGAFAGGPRLADLEVVVDDLGRDGGWLMTALDGLVEPGLLRVVDEAGATRYVLPDPVAELAAEALFGRPDEVPVRRSVSLRYLRELRRFQNQPSAGPVLGRDSANIRAALEWLVANEPALLDTGLLQGLSRYYAGTGQLAEGQAQLERVAEAGTPGSALALIRAGYLATLRYDPDSAEKLATEGMFRLDPTDHYGLAAGHNTLGCAAKVRRDYADADDHLTRALEHTRLSGDRRETYKAMHNLATLAMVRGAMPHARNLLTETLTLGQELGLPEGELGQSYASLAEIALDAEWWAEAFERADRAADMLEASGNRRLAAVQRSAQAVALTQLSGAGPAMAYVDRAEALAAGLDDKIAVAVIGLRVGVVRHAAGDRPAATRLMSTVVTGAALLGPTINPTVRDELGVALEHHADLLAADDPVTAARLLGAGGHLRRPRPEPLPAEGPTIAKRVAAAVRAALGTRDLIRELRAGAALSHRELVALLDGLAGSSRADVA